MTLLNADVTQLNNCVACGGSQLREILDLGKQPLANDYLIEPVERNVYPLILNLCEFCTHVQLSISVSPKLLFEHYLYVSSNSKTLSEYFENLKKKIVNEFGDSGLLLDVGSNDGSFLAKFHGLSWETLGVDPAANLASHASRAGVRTLSAFYNSSSATLLSNCFKVAVAMNVFAHTPNPQEMLRGLSLNVAPDGVAYIQTSQANMLVNSEFDTVYHEHISFFNVKSMKALLHRSGWFLQEVSIVNVHGKSYLWKIAKTPWQTESVKIREREEELNGYYNLEFYESFHDRCNKVTKKVISYCEKAIKEGYKIASFGSAAKGNTFLNFAKIIPDYIFDDTPLKIGRFSPLGNRVVMNPSQLGQIDDKLLFIIPAWNLKKEIVERLRMLRRNFKNDIVLTYFPEFTVTSLGD